MQFNLKFIIGLLIIILIASGFLYWQYSRMSEEVIQDETADWQTYRNEEFGFEVKYPSDWKVDGDSLGGLITEISKEGSKYFRKDNVSYSTAIYIAVPLLKFKSIDEYIAKECNTFGVFCPTFTEKIIIGDIAWEKVINPLRPEIEYFITLKDGFIYKISKQDLTGSFDNYETINEQILSSFNFIKRKEIGFETYKNEKYDFEIDYPDFFTEIETSGDSLIAFRVKGYACSPDIAVFEGTLEEKLKIIESSYYLSSQESLSVNNYDSLKIRYTIPEGGLGSVSVLLPHNSRVYVINYCEEGYFEELFSQILSTFRFIDSQPYIESINPSVGSRGTVIEIRGRNLAGFEGDLDIYFERPDGKKILLSDAFGNYPTFQDKLMKITLEEPCQEGETVYGRYSGIPSQCDYVEFTPGIYKVYAEPWGKKTNTVLFTIN